MRDYKFRAWSHGIKRGSKWIHEPQMMHEDKSGDCLVWKSQNQNIEVMQWSGLKDLNDKDVYHNDIVSYEGDRYLIVWDEERTGFYMAYWRYLDNPYHDDHIMGSYIVDSEVIGNIYENPELLEGATI